MKFVIKKEKEGYVLLSQTPIYPVPEEGGKEIRRFIRSIEVVKGPKVLEELAKRIIYDANLDETTPIELEETG